MHLHIYLRVICVNNYRFKVILSSGAVIAFVVLFFCDPATMINGVSGALTLCGSAVIPSLFPFLVISDFLVRSGLCEVMGNILSAITGWLFKLPGSAGCAILISTVGGYPVGARMTAQLLEKGKITLRQSRRMMLFCINAGPAFVIGTVGSTMLLSRKAGVILYISLIVSAMFIGIIMRFISEGEFDIRQEKSDFNPSVMSECVLHSTNSMLTMCGWIMLFSCINAYISKLPFNESTLVWINIITEVTTGCASASESFPVSVQALVMGWAGLSVHCQIMPFVKATGLKITHFFLSRIIHGSLATAIAMILFRLFPCETSVFSARPEILPAAFSVSAPAAAAMLVLSVFVIMENHQPQYTKK